MTYVKFTILIPEGNDYRKVHYHLMEDLGFRPGDDPNTLVRPNDAATATWEAVPDELM